MTVPEVDIEAFAARHAAGVTVIDVREPDEYEEAHVPGATLIPLGEVPDRVAEVPEGEHRVPDLRHGRAQPAGRRAPGGAGP